jgi:hypothetical protein
MHTIKEMEMLATKMEHMNNYIAVQAIDSHSMCEVYGNGGHSGNDCPES